MNFRPSRTFRRGFSILFFLIFLINFTCVGLTKQGVVSYGGEDEFLLDAEWEFTFGQLISPKEQESDSLNTKYVAVPSIWNGYEWKGEELSSFGYATYKLKIISDKNYADIAFEVYDFYSQFSLYLNGQLIAKNGVVGKDEDSSTPEWRPQIALASLESGDNFLVLHVSNFQHSKGGFYQSIAIGKREKLLNKREQNLIVNMLLIGGMFLVGCFFLGMFFFLHWEKKVLYFSLFSLFFSLWLSHYGLHTFTLIFDSIPWSLSTRIEYLSFYLTWLFLSEFFGDLFHQDYNKWIRKTLKFEVIILVLITLVTPLHIYSLFLNYFNYTGIFYLIYSLVVIVLAWLRKREGSFIVFSSFVILDIGVMITLLMFYRVIPNQPHLSNVLFLLSFLILSFVFAQKFAKAFKTVEMLMNKTESQKNELQKSKVVVENQAQKLTELNKSKSRFFANISHDFKTPLTLILGRVNQVLESTTSGLSKNDRRRLEQSHENGKYLLNLTNDLRLIVELQYESLKLNFEKTNVDQYFKGVLNMFGFAMEEKGINVLFNSKLEGNSFISIDKRHFAKAISNLIANAIKYGKTEGSIRIEIEMKDENILISFEDDGIGINEQQLPFIFDRYYQVSDNEYSQKEGLGIGLSISKEIVNLHGGDMKVQSILGEGSKFTIVLPGHLLTFNVGELPDIQDDLEFPEIIDRPYSRPDVLLEDSEMVSIENDNDKTILLVEDHPDVRLYIKEILEEENYSVIEARHGIHALKILKNKKVDLIITDLMMGMMDGFGLIQELKSTNEFLNTKILVISAKDGSENRLKVLKLGVNNILTKPFDPNELILITENLINRPQEKDSYTLKDAVDSATDFKKDQLRKLDQYILKTISQNSILLKDYADQLNMGERTLYRMIKELSGMTPTKYINKIKFQYAYEILRQKKVKNTSEAAFAIGFKNVTDFKKQFENIYEKTPSEILES